MRQWPPHPRHRYGCIEDCTNTSRTNSSTAQAHAMAPRSRASTRHDPAHTVGHTTYFSVCSWGRRPRTAPKATAPASPIKLFGRLHKDQPHTQRQRKSILWPHVPIASEHHDSAPQSDTQGARHGPTFPCKHTPRPRTHSRAQNVPKCLQLGQVDQAGTNGRRTRGTDTVTIKAARTQAAHTAAQRRRMPRPCVPVQAHATTQHTQSDTQRTPVSAAGAGRPGLHQWPPRLRHRPWYRQGCTSTNRTHSSTAQANAMAPRSLASSHHDPLHTTGRTTYSSV
jgi:hypothetical protein